MRPVSQQLLAQLRLTDAIHLEGQTVRNLIPPETEWVKLDVAPEKIAVWITNQLRRGYTPSPQQIVAARKSHGIRPIAYWGISERIIYRALTQLLVGHEFVLDRSPKAYVEFVTAPVEYAKLLQERVRRNALLNSTDPFGVPSDLDPFADFYFGESEIKYIVKSDITAFYQYIDHGILAQELMVRGANAEAIDVLTDLLAEVQGRAYGLPQLLDSSDLLSEVYIARVERSVVRKGMTIWRFNDDFRVACRTYADALQAIEELDSAARDVGLTVSEFKTVTYRFYTYLTDVLSISLQANQESFKLDDVEQAESSYAEDFSKNISGAVQVIQQIYVGSDIDDAPSSGVDISKAGPEQVRLLRGVFTSLTENRRPEAVGQVFILISYVPALTPSLVRYLVSLKETAQEAVAAVLIQIVREATMNEWQRQWLIYAFYESNLLEPSFDELLGERISWVRSTRLTTPSAVTKAFATVALAAAGELTFDQAMESFEACPGALTGMYGTALRVAYDRAQSPETRKRLDAVMASSPILRVLLSDES